MRSKLSITFSSLYIIFFGCQHHCEPEIFLLHDNYKGPFWVVYDQKMGLDKEYESGKRVYRIPETGILLSKFKPEFGYIDQEYFYVTKDLRILKLYDISKQYFTNGERDFKYKIKPSLERIYVIDYGIAGVCGDESDTRWIFGFVGTFNQLEEYYKQGRPIIGICEKL